jgi:hypothetical protein
MLSSEIRVDAPRLALRTDRRVVEHLLDLFLAPGEKTSKIGLDCACRTPWRFSLAYQCLPSPLEVAVLACDESDIEDRLAARCQPVPVTMVHTNGH